MFNRFTSLSRFFSSRTAPASATLRGMRERGYENGSFIAGDTPLFIHQVNKGGEEEIFETRTLKATEGRTGSVAARAQPTDDRDIQRVDVPRPSGLPLIFFTTKAATSTHVGALTGVQWYEDIEFEEVLISRPDGTFEHKKSEQAP